MASVTRNSSDENRARPDAEKGGPGPDADLPDEVDDLDEGDEGVKPKGAKVFKSRNGGKSDAQVPAVADRKPGRSFFTIYKKGQGYWVRMGTLIACTVLGLMLAYTLYDKIPTFFAETRTSVNIEVAVPKNADEAKALLNVAREDVNAGRYDEARLRLDRVNASRDNGVPNEVVGQTQDVRNKIPDLGTRGRRIGMIVAAIFLVIYIPIVLYLVNKPSNVDFLIATDSEMKKVNWTSKRELIGSTKVVIVFMFLIAILLFVIDILFGLLMYWIGVLKASPWMGLGGG